MYNYRAKTTETGSRNFAQWIIISSKVVKYRYRHCLQYLPEPIDLIALHYITYYELRKIWNKFNDKVDLKISKLHIYGYYRQDFFVK